MPPIPVESVVGYARGAGFTGDPLITAVAVALAESEGNPAAIGDVGIQTSKWGPSIGLWQIRSVKAELGKGTTRDAQKLTDPAFNAHSAFVISNGGRDWLPWSMFKNGGYVNKLPAATKAVAIARYTNQGPEFNAAADYLKNNPVTGAAAGVGEGVTSLVDNPLTELAHLARTLNDPATWTRVLEVIAGLGALVLGGVLLSREVAPSAITSVVGMAAA